MRQETKRLIWRTLRHRSTAALAHAMSPLKKRMREDGEAALAHANRGRPSHRRLPDAVRRRIVQLARSTYVGFNDHHLCEKTGRARGLFPQP